RAAASIPAACPVSTTARSKHTASRLIDGGELADLNAGTKHRGTTSNAATRGRHHLCATYVHQTPGDYSRLPGHQWTAQCIDCEDFTLYGCRVLCQSEWEISSVKSNVWACTTAKRQSCASNSAA